MPFFALTLCMLRIFHVFFFFFKINFFGKFFKEYHQPSVSNNLDPDQAQHFIKPDLGPNCLVELD